MRMREAAVINSTRLTVAQNSNSNQTLAMYFGTSMPAYVNHVLIIIYEYCICTFETIDYY